MTGQKNIIPTSSKLLAAASILILFVLCGLVFVFYKQGVQEKLKLNWVEHTEDILFRTTKILETVTDNETGSRGFVITGQSPFLEPLQQSKQFIQGQINVLAALINEDPGQRDRDEGENVEDAENDDSGPVHPALVNGKRKWLCTHNPKLTKAGFFACNSFVSRKWAPLR